MKGVNLIPARCRLARERAVRTRRWIGGSIVYGAVLLAISLFSYAVLRTDPQAVDDAAARLARSMDGSRSEMISLQPRLTDAQAQFAMSSAIADQPDWSLLLKLVSNSLDDEVVLSAIDLQPPTASAAPGNGATPVAVKTSALPGTGDEYELSITGMGKTHVAVSRYVVRLEQTGLFETVKLIKTAREPFMNAEGTSFEVSCVLIGQEGTP